MYPGQHDAIVAQDLFDAVAAKLKVQAVRRRNRPTRAIPGPLAGLLFDSSGQPMSPSFAYGKGGKLYRYYIAMALQVGASTATSLDGIRRVSAPAVEQFLVEILRRVTGRHAVDIKTMIARVELRSTETHLVLDVDGVAPDDHPELVLAAVVRRLVPGEQAVVERGSRPAIRLVLPQPLRLRGGRTRISGFTEDDRGSVNRGLVNGLRRAHADLLAVNASPFTRPARMMEAAAPATQHHRQICRLAFMAPDIQRRILTGRQPRGLSLRQVLKSPMPLAWADQRAWLEAVSKR